MLASQSAGAAVAERVRTLASGIRSCEAQGFKSAALAAILANAPRACGAVWQEVRINVVLLLAG